MLSEAKHPAVAVCPELRCDPADLIEEVDIRLGHDPRVLHRLAQIRCIYEPARVLQRVLLQENDDLVRIVGIPQQQAALRAVRLPECPVLIEHRLPGCEVLHFVPHNQVWHLVLLRQHRLPVPVAYPCPEVTVYVPIPLIGPPVYHCEPGRHSAAFPRVAVSPFLSRRQAPGQPLSASQKKTPMFT